MRWNVDTDLLVILHVITNKKQMYNMVDFLYRYEGQAKKEEDTTIIFLSDVST